MLTIYHWRKICTFPNCKNFLQNSLEFGSRLMAEFIINSLDVNVRKQENAGYQHFVFSHNVFKILFLKVIETGEFVFRIKDELFTTRYRVLMILRKKPFKDIEAREF